MSEWRTGRKVGRTIYRDDVLVGVMDTPELATSVVESINVIAERDRYRATLEKLQDVCVLHGACDTEHCAGRVAREALKSEQ